ncbi:helix-turn-helix transcriptional regulator [Sphaerisporangium sp. NPDC088356]|uniref:helix-turn-helix domain-containing protein n=1 Tax=Sphaerisporangium sp. NPDC088356 TaxID=3154871 RepID=UPI00344823B4
MAEIEETIGQRVHRIRRARGIDRAVLAEQLGYSAEWLKSVETGKRQLDRYSVITQIADALQVEVVTLLGLPHVTAGDHDQQRAHIAIPSLRKVLLRGYLPSRRAGAPFALDELRERVNTGHHQARHGRYGDLLTDLPLLLVDIAHTTVGIEGAERERAWGMMAEGLHDAALSTKKLGYIDLATIAASQATKAAESSGDPLLTTATRWTQAEVYMAAGAVDEAHELLSSAVDELDPMLGEGGPEVWSLWGTMHLVESTIEATWRRGGEAAGHLVEAAAAADRVGSGRNAYMTEFGPENRALIALQVDVELGAGPDALPKIAGVPIDNLPKERRARHRITRSVAYSRAGDDDEAMRELLEGHRIAPECVANHPLARDVVKSAMQRALTLKGPIATMVNRLGIPL